ncbi:hypothetical protein [Streptomyces sp. NPDC003077]|uniref:hypothetical protein n=1 Tax=Streptomyces sp. NPDC003077 TaxID=3154443 RepID=UPI00339FE176
MCLVTHGGSHHILDGPEPTASAHPASVPAAAGPLLPDVPPDEPGCVLNALTRVVQTLADPLVAVGLLATPAAVAPHLTAREPTARRAARRARPVRPGRAVLTASCRWRI